MSIIQRAAVLKQASISLRQAPANSLVQRRAAHIENTLYNNFPFKYNNKRAFAVKCFVFFSTGFAIPFVAVAYQLRKASA